MSSDYSTIDALAEKAVSELISNLKGLNPFEIQDRLCNQVKTDMLTPEQRAMFYLCVGDKYIERGQHSVANAAYGLVIKATSSSEMDEEFGRILLAEIGIKRFFAQRVLVH